MPDFRILFGGAGRHWRRLWPSPWRRFDRDLKRLFAAPGVATEARYEHLFRYFLTGFLSYRTRERSMARYPGAPSHHGHRVDDLEGFSRMAPLLAAWLAGGRPRIVESLFGRPVDLAMLLRDGLLNGADPDSRGYWGMAGDHDQRIVEAADLALALWLSRRFVWDAFSTTERERIVAWLRKAAAGRVHDNNWHLFPILTSAVVRSLGLEIHNRRALDHYRRFKRFYRGDGWFEDGPDGPCDYYNAWTMHYALFWVSRVWRNFDAVFLRDVLRAFVDGYKHLIAPDGVPIMGRSVCYRMAVPAPLVAAALVMPDSMPPGLARRALDAVWRHFVAAGAVEAGIATQGYYGTDLRILDHYSGPASPLWALRSLVVAFYAPPGHAFWTAPEEQLPVEHGDFDITIPSIGWRISGNAASGEVRLFPRAGGGLDGAPIETYGWRERLRDSWAAKPARPKNTALKYELRCYGSRVPVWAEAKTTRPHRRAGPHAD